MTSSEDEMNNLYKMQDECRFCRTQNNLTELTKQIAALIDSCYKIKIIIRGPDGKPKLICTECIAKMNKRYRLQSQVKLFEATFNKLESS